MHRSSFFTTPDPDSPDRELGEVYLRTVAANYAANIERWADEMGDWPPDWVGAATLSDLSLRLTRDEAQQLADDLMAVLVRYREAGADRGDDGQERIQVVTQYQLFPRRGQLDALLAALREAVDADGGRP